MRGNVFILDRKANRLKAVETKKFKCSGLTEVKHLQEWIAHDPTVLGGEELLILQKEFAGFDETNERLDLLALDKTGRLVIIENKLDDSGRDVVWQALKYTSYCSSLTKPEIVEIFQRYLNSSGNQSESGAVIDAATQICEFLDVPNIDEVTLNHGNTQRIVMVAAHFRKEVTSTALWLLGKDVTIQCFKVTQHTLDDQIFITMDQIVPTPEAQKLMIAFNAKEADEKSTEVTRTKSESIRSLYWKQALDAFRSSKCNLYDNISSSEDHWLEAGSGLGGCPYVLHFLKDTLRVKVSIAKNSRDENEFIFDFLREKRDEIEKDFGDKLEWLNHERNISSYIQFVSKVDGFNEECWEEHVQWHLTHMIKLEKAFKAPLQEASEALKNKSSD